MFNLKIISRFTMLCAILFSGIACSSKPIRASGDFDRFIGWWANVYDNKAQTISEAKNPPDQQNEHRKIFLRHVDLPAFGQHVYYLEWQKADAPNIAVRQRIYAFELLDDVIKLNLHIFPTDANFIKKTAGAYHDPERLKGVTPDDMVPLPGCDIYFKRDGDAFLGSMRRGTCIIPELSTGENVYSWSQLKLTSTTFEYLDGWFHQDTDEVAYKISPNWFVFDRVETP